MSQKSSLIAYRGLSGLGFLNGPPGENEFEGFTRDTGPLCKDMTFSKDGKLFAWCSGEKVKIVSTATFEPVGEIHKPRASSIRFSPKETYLSIWEPYVAKGNVQDSSNLEIWDIKEMNCIKGFIQKRQADCHPQWTSNEELCARNVNNEVHFYENSDFSKIGKKIFIQKVSSFSISPGLPNYYVACFIPVQQARPAEIKVFAYPKFEGPNAAIVHQSFFQADKVEFHWHKLGNDLIVRAIGDIDKTGKSYYGVQYLYYLSVKGDTCRVVLNKEGAIYGVQWSPKAYEFCVVYGTMPSKAMIFNLKCEPLFDFGTGTRNGLCYSMSGNNIFNQPSEVQPSCPGVLSPSASAAYMATRFNLGKKTNTAIVIRHIGILFHLKLLLFGLGAVQPNVEVWDVKKRTMISKFIPSDSTYVSWSPDEEYILTATTSPRLRIGNGYRFWHYTGSLLQEVFLQGSSELWDLQWLPIPENEIREKTISYTPLKGIQSSKPQASKEVYRPPGAKGQPSSFRLHVEEAPKTLSQPAITKNQKKKEARKAKKEQEKDVSSVDNSVHVEQNSSNIGGTPKLSGDPSKDKKIKALFKKLEQIQKLKQDQQAGKSLELNQLEKLKKEDEITEELQNLLL